MVDRVRSYNVDLTPRRYHFYAVFLFILGTLFPPLAVAARFGVGTDFFINVVLTLCGYIPGHAHNFYIQNVRNNKTHRRTPKWVQKFGLVNIAEIRRKERRSQWASRYNERNPHSALDDQSYEEGQEGSGSSVNVSEERDGRQNGEYWKPTDERFYGQKDASSSVVTGGSGGGRWHYPANFDDALPEPARKKSSKKKDKKDRWARTEDAYTAQDTSTRRRKSKKRRSKTVDAETASRVSDDTTEFPEDPEGGLYGDRRPPPDRGDDHEEQEPRQTRDEDVFNHEL